MDDVWIVFEYSVGEYTGTIRQGLICVHKTEKEARDALASLVTHDTGKQYHYGVEKVGIGA